VNGSGQAAGRVLMVGVAGETLDAATARRLGQLHPAGIILFRRNVQSAPQLRELVSGLRESIPRPAWIAIDQEGGRVSRLEPLVGPTPSAARLARAGARAAREVGRATGQALRALDIDLDFAPVIDLCEPEASNGIGDRSFGSATAPVVELAGAFLDGLQDAGVAGCLKHFPGLGSTVVDSHVELPTCDRSRDALERRDLAAFRGLIPRAAAVMVGHGHYPALDPSRRPATLSAAIVSGLLRDALGFRGLVISDDMEMGAVSALDVDGAAAAAAIAAGCDLLIYGADLGRAEAARDALARRAAAEPAFAARLQQARERLGRAAEERAGHLAPVLPWDAARAALGAAASRVAVS
jgi:beta-N-acetylhexosaminidase